MSVKIDDRINSLIKYSNHINHRCFFILIGDNTKIYIPTIYNILSSNSTRPVDSIIWCHKNSNIVKEVKSAQANKEEESKLHEFFKSQDIQFFSYNESEKILGQTVDMLILQDFESLTPNLIALSIETVRGGGMIVLLLDNVNSIESMINRRSDLLLDDDFVPRYNKRLFRSLINMSFTLFLDSAFKILPISKFNLDTSKLTIKKSKELNNPEVTDLDNLLINLTKTTDQNNVVKELFKAVKDRTERSIYSIQAGRGRGKSVALGISIAKAIDLKFSSIYISAPALENIKMVFEFIIRGLETIGYKKYKDFKIIYSFKNKKRLVQRIEILKNIKQTIEYHSPFCDLKYHPDMLIIDEAAAIPLPLLKKLLFPNLIIMATTSSGYEGTGRAFATKMTEYFRNQVNSDSPFVYKELFMDASIRYGENDPVEKWLNTTLLLNTEVKKIDRCPLPSNCELYYVNKDVLFSGNTHSEKILNDIFGLFIASHYKNSPDDIQILADSPSHEIFTLITPNEDDISFPKVLCAIHISFEGRCEKSLIKKGNLIPWIVSDTHCDTNFLNYLGVRIVRIAVHPDYMSMGYGSYSLELIMKWFKTNQHSYITRLRIPESQKEENIMFYESNDILIPKISWIGTSFGVTEKLMNFWKKHEMIPICIKQKVSFITGENTIILLKTLDDRLNDKFKNYYKNFKFRFVGQLGYNFKKLNLSICLLLLFNEVHNKIEDTIKFSKESCERIERYCKGTIDFLEIIDLIPLIARMYFCDQFPIRLSILQQSVLLQIGCQHKSIEDVSENQKLKYYEVNTILMKIFNLLKDDMSKQ